MDISVNEELSLYDEPKEKIVEKTEEPKEKLEDEQIVPDWISEGLIEKIEINPNPFVFLDLEEDENEENEELFEGIVNLLSFFYSIGL